MDPKSSEGRNLVGEGRENLGPGRESAAALLVAIGAPRPRRLGLSAPELVGPSAEHHLYALLARADPDSARSRYNALLRRLVNFEHSCGCAD